MKKNYLHRLQKKKASVLFFLAFLLSLGNVGRAQTYSASTPTPFPAYDAKTYLGVYNFQIAGNYWSFSNWPYSVASGGNTTTPSPIATAGNSALGYLTYTTSSGVNPSTTFTGNPTSLNGNTYTYAPNITSSSISPLYNYGLFMQPYYTTTKSAAGSVYMAFAPYGYLNSGTENIVTSAITTVLDKSKAVDYQQFNVTLPAGEAFNPNSTTPLILDIASAAGSSNNNYKAYTVYYQYSTAAGLAPTGPLSYTVTGSGITGGIACPSLNSNLTGTSWNTSSGLPTGLSFAVGSNGDLNLKGTSGTGNYNDGSHYYYQVDSLTKYSSANSPLSDLTGSAEVATQIPPPPNDGNLYTVVTVQVKYWDVLPSAAPGSSVRLSDYNLYSKYTLNSTTQVNYNDTNTHAPVVYVAPVVTSLSPASVNPGTTNVTTLTINGTGFVSGSATTATINGNSRTVTYVSPTQITIPVSSSDFSAPGSLPVVVTNTSSDGTVTNSAAYNFTVNAVPSVAIAGGGRLAQQIAAANNPNILDSFSLSASSSYASLTSVTVPLSGSYTSSDIANFKLYYNSSNTFTGATLLTGATVSSASTGSGENVTFSGLNSTIASGSTVYYFLVANLNTDAVNNRTLSVGALSTSSFSFASTTTPSGSVNASGTQTVYVLQIAFMDDIATQPSGNIIQNSSALLAGYYIQPTTGATANITGVNVYANNAFVTSTATSTDLSNVRIYRDANGNGLYDAGTDVLVSNSVAFSNSSSTPMALTMNETITAKTQYLIVADVADVLVSTIGHTVQLYINNNDFTTSLIESGSMNGANQLNIVAPVGTTTIANGTTVNSISSVANSSATAVAAYNFAVNDVAVSTAAPTELTQIVIGQGTGNGVSDWTTILSGASLTDGTNTVTNGVISSSGITFSNIPVTNSSLGYIASGATKNYTLKVWLKSSLVSPLNTTINGTNLAFALNTSSFTSLGNQIVPSQSITAATPVSVVASKLVFLNQPSSENLNITLSTLNVQAEDANGNYATTYNANPITIASSPTGVTGTLSVSASNGQGVFSNLKFTSGYGTYSFAASSTGLTSATSSSFQISNGLYFSAANGSSWESAKWQQSSAGSAAYSWFDGNDAIFNGTAGTVTVGANHSMPSLTFDVSGYNLAATGAGIGTLTLSGTSPSININGTNSTNTETINTPINVTGNLSLIALSASSTVTVNLGAASTSTSTNYYTPTFGSTATTTLAAGGIDQVNFFGNNPFGALAANTVNITNASGTPNATVFSTSGNVWSNFPIVIPSNIVLGNNTEFSCGPNSTSTFGNELKFNGRISGNPLFVSTSIDAGYVAAGKGITTFGGQNTYNGTTMIWGASSQLVLNSGTSSTLPTNTDLLFINNAGGLPMVDLHGNSQKVASISVSDGTDLPSRVTTTTINSGFFNSNLYLPTISAGTTSGVGYVTVKYNAANNYYVGQKVFGAGIVYGTTIAAITHNVSVNGSDGNPVICDQLTLSAAFSTTNANGQGINSILSTSGTGYYIFFESSNQATLSIGSASKTGFNYGPTTGHVLDHTNSNFGGTINGNIALTLTADNNPSNKLTLLYANTYYGLTTVSGGTLKLAYSAGNTIPSTNSVTVNGGVLEISSNQTLASLTLTSGSVIVDAGVTLTVGSFTNTGGTITNNGTINLTGTSVTLSGTIGGNVGLTGTSAQTVTGNLNLTNLTLINTAGAAINSTVTIAGILTVTNGNLNTTNGTVTLKSTSITNTAVLAPVTGSLTGNVTVERFIPSGWRVYRDLGAGGVANAGNIFQNWQESGVNTNGYGIQITGFAGTTVGFDAATGFDYSLTGNHSLFTYINNIWDSVTVGTKNTTLDPFQGFRVLVRGDRTNNLQQQLNGYMTNSATVRSTGNLIYGNVTYNVGSVTSDNNYTSSYGLTSGASAYSFITNPYACTVDWKTVISNSPTMNGTYWYCDPTFTTNENGSVTGNGRGYTQFIAYNKSTGVSNTFSQTKVGQYLQPGQAFFVQNGTSGTPTLNFTESSKSIQTRTAVFGNETTLNRISVGLFKGGSNLDGTVSAFSNSFSSSFGDEDAIKFPNATENISFTIGGKYLAINGYTIPTSTDELKLGLSNLAANTTYTIKVDASQYAGLQASLKDIVLGTETLLTIDGIKQISFTTSENDASSYNNRYSIVFVGTLPVKKINVTAVQLKGSEVAVNWSVIGATNVVSYKVQHSSNGIDFNDLTTVPASGKTSYSYTDIKGIEGINYYRINAVDETGVVTYSDVAKVALSNVPQISVNPNPVTDDRFNLQLSNLASGKYTIKLTDILGKQVFSSQISHAGGTSVYTVASVHISGGTYILTLVGDNGSSYLTKVVVK